MTAPQGPLQKSAGTLLRLALPAMILAGGWLGYALLSVEVEKKEAPEAPPRVLRTRVQDLDVTDYQVTVQTHGIVQAHNQVSLAAEVSGVVTKVNPAFEPGAYFAEGELLVEIDSRNYVAAVEMAKSRLLAAKSKSIGRGARTNVCDTPTFNPLVPQQ